MCKPIVWLGRLVPQKFKNRADSNVQRVTASEVIPTIVLQRKFSKRIVHVHTTTHRCGLVTSTLPVHPPMPPPCTDPHAPIQQSMLFVCVINFRFPCRRKISSTKWPASGWGVDKCTWEVAKKPDGGQEVRKKCLRNRQVAGKRLGNGQAYLGSGQVVGRWPQSE